MYIYPEEEVSKLKGKLASICGLQRSAAPLTPPSHKVSFTCISWSAKYSNSLYFWNHVTWSTMMNWPPSTVSWTRGFSNMFYVYIYIQRLMINWPPSTASWTHGWDQSQRLDLRCPSWTQWLSPEHINALWWGHAFMQMQKKKMQTFVNLKHVGAVECLNNQANTLIKLVEHPRELAPVQVLSFHLSCKIIKIKSFHLLWVST